MPLSKIAVEEHYLDPATVRRVLGNNDELERLSAAAGVMPGYYRPILALLADFDDRRLSTMDEHGIEWSILALTTPGVQQMTEPTTAVRAAQAANDFLAEQVGRRPDRYAGFAAVPLQNPPTAAAELRRCVHELDFVGALINGYTNITDPDDAAYYDQPEFEVFWQMAAQLAVPVYLHPRPALPATRTNLASHPELIGATWGFGTETATHTLQLIFSGLFDRHPGLQLILGHLGEGLPALLWRTQYCFELNAL